MPHNNHGTPEDLRKGNTEMLNYHVKIGLIPLRRDCTPRPGMFNWEYAEARSRKIVKYIEDTFASDTLSFIDLKGINPVEVLFSENDVPAVVQRMRDEKANAIFFINGNFGNEEAAAMVAGELNLPTLIWAPLDDVFEPDGLRHTDSQCGLFGVSRQLQRRNITFTHISNCRVEDPLFAEEFLRFVRVACMVGNFRNMRIAEVGMRPKPFCSVIFNEGELLQRFGIQIVPISMALIEQKFKTILNERKEELAEGVKLLRSKYDIDSLTEPLLDKIYAFVLLYRDIFSEYRVDVISSECWTSMGIACGAVPCIAYTILFDMGYIVACESDMHGAITMALLSSAALGKKAPFFGEFTVRHPEDRNVQLLWHCGQFPLSTCHPDCKPKTTEQRAWFRVKDGIYTVSRFEQEDGKYMILNGTCETAEGPFTNGTYLWARFRDLDAWEKRLIYGPYIHHMSEIEGDYTAEIREFCRYIPALKADNMD